MEDRKIHFSFTRKQQEFNPTRFLFSSFREGPCSVTSWYLREKKPWPWSRNKWQSACCMPSTGPGGTRGCSVQHQGGPWSSPPNLGECTDLTSKTRPSLSCTHPVSTRAKQNPFFFRMVPLCYSLNVTYQRSRHRVVISTFDFLGAHFWRNLAVRLPIK